MAKSSLHTKSPLVLVVVLILGLGAWKMIQRKVPTSAPRVAPLSSHPLSSYPLGAPELAHITGLAQPLPPDSQIVNVGEDIYEYGAQHNIAFLAGKPASVRVVRFREGGTVEGIGILYVDGKPIWDVVGMAWLGVCEFSDGRNAVLLYHHIMGTQGSYASAVYWNQPKRQLRWSELGTHESPAIALEGYVRNGQCLWSPDQ